MTLRFPLLKLAAACTLSIACSQPGPDDVIPEAPEPAESFDELEQESDQPDPQIQRGDSKWRHGDHFKRHGPAALLHRALRLEDLSVEQRRSIEAALSELERPRGEKREFRAELRRGLAEAVRDGNVDVSSFRTHIDTAKGRAGARIIGLRSALDELHAILTVEQRQTLVDGVRERLERRQRKFQRFARGKDELGKRRGRGLHHFAADLELSDDQRARWRAAKEQAGLGRPDREQFRARFAEHRERVDFMLSAFETEEFDAASHVPSDAGERIVSKMENKIQRVALLVPILDEEQRSALAEQIESRARRRYRHHRH